MAILEQVFVVYFLFTPYPELMDLHVNWGKLPIYVHYVQIIFCPDLYFEKWIPDEKNELTVAIK